MVFREVERLVVVGGPWAIRWGLCLAGVTSPCGDGRCGGDVAGLLTLISAFGVPSDEADQVAAREKTRAARQR
jgi:hypothetical protein